MLNNIEHTFYFKLHNQAENKKGKNLQSPRNKIEVKSQSGRMHMPVGGKWSKNAPKGEEGGADGGIRLGRTKV